MAIYNSVCFYINNKKLFHKVVKALAKVASWNNIDNLKYNGFKNVIKLESKQKTNDGKCQKVSEISAKNCTIF